MNEINEQWIKTRAHSKKSFYRWIGLVIGIIFGLIASFIYYSWGKKAAVIHFQKNIGESKFMIEYQKWANKNPLQAKSAAVKIWKEIGLYEELKNETNPEIIQQKVTKRIEELDDDETKNMNKKMMEIYQEDCSSFWESFEKNFPWYLRYARTILFFLVLVSCGVGFLIGYSLEPEEKLNY